MSRGTGANADGPNLSCHGCLKPLMGAQDEQESNMLQNCCLISDALEHTQAAKPDGQAVPATAPEAEPSPEPEPQVSLDRLQALLCMLLATSSQVD